MLILVVGPSGAGKDTLLDSARRMLADDPRFRFVRRVITRPAGAGGEDHEPATEAAFAARRFALHWRAHGLSYGIPLDIEADLARGIAVVANVSRGIVAQAAARYPVRVIQITAPSAVLAERLSARGREGADDIAGRLARDVVLPDGVAVITVMNDQTREVGAARFLAALRLGLDQGPPSDSLVSFPGQAGRASSVPALLDPSRADPTHADATHADPGRPDPGRPDPGRPDPGRIGS